MNQDFFTLYQKFTVREEALELSNLLKQKGIPYKLETGASGFDPSFVFKDEFRILLRPEDFDTVSGFFTEDVQADYYLFSFTEDELMEILEKQDEWSSFDIILAKKLLKEKGKTIPQETIELLEKKRLEALKQPDKNSRWGVIAGYFFALLGGWLGLLIGIGILTVKKKLPNGEKVFSYSSSDRKHGVIIILICIASVVVSTLLALNNM